ncbi:hypothetical protein BIZ93_07570 [Helicobacter pylori]|nr:hypothetical protein BIZ93_07570 [Helicobacter pylori]
MIALRNTRKLDLISVNPNRSLLAQLKMLKCLVAVISRLSLVVGHITMKPFKEFGLKEAAN